VKITRDFYREFPGLLRQDYQFGQRAELKDHCRKVWKTVGDEIIFCCRVLDLEHLAICVAAFLKALRNFGVTLDNAGRYLDVKGAGWIAAFPAPNVTVSLGSAVLGADQFDEGFEKKADLDPRSVDFLGNAIDGGFRVASHAASDRFALSVELAWLLARAAADGLFSATFSYHDRHILKGVLRNRPYPIVSLDTERNMSRKEVSNAERQLRGSSSPTSYAVRDFLAHFMHDEGIEPPVLARQVDDMTGEPPPTYQSFQKAWIADVEEIKQREQVEAASEKPENDTGVDDLPSSVSENIFKILSLFRETDQGINPKKDE
jgi:hypothetical protein